MKKPLIALIPVALFITGCATSYHAKGWMGNGYSETLLSHDSAIVNFAANSRTSNEKVKNYSLRRAAELTLEKGYHYFAILSSEDQTKSSTSQHSTLGIYSISTNVTTIDKPALSITIKCYETIPEGIDVIDARFFLENNKA